MEKRTACAMTAAGFGVLLVLSAIRGGYTEQIEMAQLQDAMRNLKRVDNLQMKTSYVYMHNGMPVEEMVDVWADMLNGSWVGEYTSTDEDGTRLYLKQFCDGLSVYAYEEWTGEWIPEEKTDIRVPNLESITVLTYDAGDILETRVEEADGHQKISYTFTSVFLEQEHDKKLSEMETVYRNYEKMGMKEESLESIAFTVEQFARSWYEDVSVTYTIDENQILCSMECTASLIKPEIIKTASGGNALGEEQEIQLLLRTEVIRYNQDGTLNKIDQSRNELL